MAEQAREAAARIEVHHRLIEQREQERLQIARDLHDGPVQDLTAAVYALQSMKSDCVDSKVMDGINSVRQSLEEQVADLRAFTQNLRPPTLARFGLEKAIRAHLDNFEEKNPDLTIKFASRQDARLVPEAIRVALYRIFQEALNNIVKHARATQVDISLEKDESLVSLTVQDNGNGFDLPTDWLAMAREGHLGLVGMRERAEAIQGSLKVLSQPGQGTTIRVTAPLGKKGTGRLGK